MTDEPKRCSSCGKPPQGNNWHTYGKNPKDEMHYFCANHDCPNGFHEALTLEQWNTRPIEDELSAEVERLKQNLDNRDYYEIKLLKELLEGEK